MVNRRGPRHLEAHLTVYRGAARLRYHTVWECPQPEGLPRRPGRGPRKVLGGAQSSASRMRLSTTIRALPWELLGDRMVLLTQTYPGDWRRYVPDGRVWEEQRREFLQRWGREFGERAVGLWAKEFQKSGRPHTHMYLKVPESVSAEDYEGLRARTLLGQRLERQYGRYAGRARIPAIGGKYGGEFAMWLRTAWSKTVGTERTSSRHHARGVDVRVFFWSDEVARTQDRIQVAAYLAKESAKWTQKRPPEGFTGMGRYWGVLPGSIGFGPEALFEGQIDLAVARELGRRMERWYRLKAVAEGRPLGAFNLRRGGDGLTVWLRHDQMAKLLRRAEAAAAAGAAGSARRTDPPPPGP